MEANKNESLNLSQFFEFFENDQNVVDFLRCMGLISREDLNQKREDNDEDFKNEVNIYNSTGLDERTADIKSGITHNFNNVDTS